MSDKYVVWAIGKNICKSFEDVDLAIAFGNQHKALGDSIKIIADDGMWSIHMKPDSTISDYRLKQFLVNSKKVVDLLTSY